MYYEQIKAVALPFVQHFLTDITDHDAPALADYDGDIVYAMRATGTNLILLDGEPLADLAAEWIEQFTFTPNERYFLGTAGKLREVKRDKAFKVWQTYRKLHQTTETGPHPLFG